MMVRAWQLSAQGLQGYRHGKVRIIAEDCQRDGVAHLVSIQKSHQVVGSANLFVVELRDDIAEYQLPLRIAPGAA